MVQKSIIISLIALFFGVNSFAQSYRTAAMGGLSYSITDKDNSLTPFNFGNNPAWIYPDETETHLLVTPSFSQVKGDYRRPLEADAKDFYYAGFRGVKTLGDYGTFIGYTDYSYELRKNNYRTLLYDTYSGEAFFVQDTTIGNYRYNGPKVELMYSWEVYPNLYAGITGNYKILDGLKNVYTFAKTTYREVGASAGLAYSIGGNIIIGARISYLDNQEKIDAKDVNLLDVEFFNYRGETFAIKRRSSSLEETIRKKTVSMGGQFYYKYNEDLQFAVQGNYTPSNSRIAFPKSGLIDVEEGYSTFENTDIRSKIQYRFSESIMMGITGGYFNRNSWSRNSLKNLLLWEWDINEVFAGVGLSYAFKNIPLLIGAEYELSNVKADSSKHVDSKIINLKSTDHLIRFGIEYEFMPYSYLRSGFNFQVKEYDLITGGKDVNRLAFNLGFEIPLSESISIAPYLEYQKLFLKEYSDIYRSNLSGFVTLRLNYF